MKKTKIIILTVAALLIIALPALFVTQKTKAKNTPELPIQDEYKLPDISVVVAKNFSNFSISSGNENKLIVKYSGKKINSEKPYKIHNDSIFVEKSYNPATPDKILKLQLKNINKLIVGDTATVHIYNISTTKLEISSKKSHVSFSRPPYDNSELKIKNQIDSFYYFGRNGLLHMENTQIEHAIIELRNSNLYMLDKLNIKELHLQVKDSSNIIQFTSIRGNIQNMDLDIDNSSYCDISKQ